ncbi:MAG: NAD(P)H-hydrate dehydratase [Burkholderiaceae bacterium]|nr:NAD(P)H-hydrate dehydratase [Burkholderiaceae bacterium]
MPSTLPAPQAVLPSRRPWPLHGLAATRQLEAQGLAATPPQALMQRAGLATARLALALAPHAQRIWVAAGPGNNGGDALEAALHLQRWGRQVQVSLLATPERLPADARVAWQRAQAAGLVLQPGLPAQIDAELCLDGLLGLGLGPRSARPADDAIAEAMRRLNAQAAPVLAIDLPSGLDGGSGQVHGGLAVNATHTLSLLTLKPGLFTAAGRDHAGRIWFDDLGLGEAWASAPADAWLAGPPTATPRRHAQHKGSFGDVLVLGGASGMGGAALLAARAALAAGAGRVFVARLDGQQALLTDALRPELMPRQAAEVLAPEFLAAATVVCGCGGGRAIAPLLPAVLEHARRLVLDADALNALAADPVLAASLAQRQSATLLTPHPLEAARLLGCGVAQVQADRLASAQALALQTGAGVLLKGSGTVIAPAGTALPPAALRINPTGNARLGTAGSGDVLAGWLGGRWSQTGEHQDASGLQAAADSVWCHGRAAETGPLALPLRAADLIEAMVETLAAVAGGTADPTA